MKRWFTLWMVALAALAVTEARGAEAKRMEIAKLFRQTPVRIAVDPEVEKGLTREWTKILFCSGYEILTLPELVDCPPSREYDTVTGIGICYQQYEVPKVSRFTQGGGLFAMECVLDFENMEPRGEPSCDYSQCLYTNSPRIWPKDVLDPIELQIGPDPGLGR